MTTQLGGSASHISVGKVGHGLMMMTWKPTPVPDEDCFEAIKASINAQPAGTKAFINSGEFYGSNPRTANLELVARFFDKYPELADKAFLSVKGGTKADSLEPDSSEENIRRSVDTILAKLDGKKRLDLYQNARVDKKYPIEETIKILAKLVKEGKFDHIGVSECSAETLRRAYAVHPIAAIEIEISPWSYEEETKKVISTANELGVAVVGYSPLGRGFLTGAIKKPEDFEAGDFRRHLARFQEESIKHNMAIVDALTAIATKKHITTAQLSIAWVAYRGSHVIPLPGSSNPKRTLENIAGGNVELTESDVSEIDQVIQTHGVRGDRYTGNRAAELLWG